MCAIESFVLSGCNVCGSSKRDSESFVNVVGFETKVTCIIETHTYCINVFANYYGNCLI